MWLHFTGKVNKFVTFWCEIFSRYYTAKIINIGLFVTELFFKINNVDILGHSLYYFVVKGVTRCITLFRTIKMFCVKD